MAKTPNLNATLLAGGADALRLIADAMPPRTSIRQVLAILEVFAANAGGRSITMSDLRESASGVKSGDGVKVVGQSIAKTFEVFYEPTKANPDWLGWVRQELDDNDRRIKYLRLTEKGEAVAAAIQAALSRGAK
jgi:hypothetical protein